MGLAYSSDENSALVSLLIQELGIQPEKINRNIYEDDKMFQVSPTFPTSFSYLARRDEGLVDYFQVGNKLFSTYKQVIDWWFGGFDNVSSFLDFASGHGRGTRFLLQELPPEKLWVSDIVPDAVQFQKEQFGVNGIVSVADPEAFAPDRKFDCIFVISLFSHLPENTFVPWLEKLYNLLTPRGILLFSVYGADYLPAGYVMPENGLYYSEVSENQALDSSIYGLTWVTPEFVTRAINQATKGQAAFHLLPKGINNFQDAYIVTPDKTADFSTLHHDNGPTGLVERFSLEGSELTIEGWAVDLSPECSVVEVEVVIVSGETQIRQSCQPSLSRPKVPTIYNRDDLLHSGWKCQLTLPAQIDLKHDMVAVKFISNRKIAHLAFIGTLENGLQDPLEHKQHQMERLLTEYSAIKAWSEHLLTHYHRLTKENQRLMGLWEKLSAEATQREATIERLKRDLTNLEATKTVRFSKTATLMARQIGTRLRKK